MELDGHWNCVNVHAPTLLEAIEIVTEGLYGVRTIEVTDHGIVRYFRDPYGFPTWAAETLDVWGDCSPSTEEENAAFEEMRCDT